MKIGFFALLAALSLGACSSGTTNGTSGTGTSASGTGTGTSSAGLSSSGSGTGSSTTSSGTTGGPAATYFPGPDAGPCTGSLCTQYTTITFSTVDVHPAAKAALAEIGFPVPNITDGGYGLVLQGVGISPTFTAQLTTFGTYLINSTTGPYTFTVSEEQLTKQGAVGVLGGINPILANGTAATIGDGGFLPQPDCATWNTMVAAVGAILDGGPGTVMGYLADAGFQDYLIPSGLAAPSLTSGNVTGAIAYAEPMSYAVMLNCAGQPTKTTRDTDLGIAVEYATDSSGAPLSGVSYTVIGAGNTPTADYYSANYTAQGSAATDVTGIGEFTNVTASVDGFGTVNAVDSAADTFNTTNNEIATEPNTVFNTVFVRQ